VGRALGLGCAIAVLAACGGQSRSVAGTGGDTGSGGTTSAGAWSLAGGTANGGASNASGAVGGTENGGASHEPGVVGGRASGGASNASGVGGMASSGASNAPGVAGAAQGGPPALSGEEQSIDVVEAPSHGEPNDAAFVWQYGLGNWFQLTLPPSRSLHGDAIRAAVVPPRGTSTSAYRMQGSDSPNGADLYVQLNHPLGRDLDLSQYAGIGFWAKLDGDTGELAVALATQDESITAPPNPPFVMRSVRAEWQEFRIPFADFGIDGSAVAEIHFVVGQGGGAFDLWLDELSLLCFEECPTVD
jgi:hypothetical protein